MGSEMFRACRTVDFDLEQLPGAKGCVHQFLLTNVYLMVFMLPDCNAEIFPHIGKHPWHFPHNMTKTEPKEFLEGTR